MQPPMETIPSWQLEIVEKSLDQRTILHLGVSLLLEFQILSGESPSVTIPSWQFEIVIGSIDQQTIENLGVVILQEFQIIIYTGSFMVIVCMLRLV